MKSRWVCAVFLCALGGWHLLLRGHGRGIPLITDEGEYAAVARAWSEGGLPYRDAFSQKPPMVFLFYRAAAAVSDVPESPRAPAALAALATLLFFFLLTPRAWSLAGRLAAPATFAALAALPIGDYSFPANTETFVNLFASLAALALLRSAPFPAGLAAGASLCTKQTALWTMAAFALVAVMTKRKEDRVRSLSLYALGAALIPAAWVVYFAARGGLGDYWRATWAGNARYASVLVMTEALQGQISWFATTLLPRLLMFSAPALALGAYSLRGLRAGCERPLETLAVLWFGGAVAGALTGLFLFPHYFLILAAPLSLAAACGVERMTSRKGRAAAVLVLAAWPALLAPRLFFIAGARERARTLLHPNPIFESEALGAEIRRRAAPGDRLHVFGSESSLFSYSGLRSATPHTYCYPLTLFPKGRAEIVTELAQLERNPPRFVVWSTQPLSTLISSNLGLEYRDGLRALLSRGYAFAGLVRVSDAPGLPRFEPSSAGALPDFDGEDQLLLFAREEMRRGRSVSPVH
ncbi:MAG: hypothetical protein A2V88_06260 [Elusimicrobia bacterium RBG_16_66_12]|nr:MAG: hypothetical protein A2V88_06260 [Elusimicrobia bacterium RBG_16_66_12]